ncbi:hypothetical protein [Mycolicibacterium palauense]|uniref:hypothetical protein n=1 Tax=Mycolicibacterium palauense TaxID=2034511 RepID=UPI0011453DFF|nr:hypothetical protein [Mycolicibacterium palauense]
MADLLAGEGRVIIGEHSSADLAEVRSAVNGTPVTFDQSAVPTDDQLVADYLANRPEWVAEVGPEERAQLWRVWTAYGETEERAARSLGVDKPALATAMAQLWGRTLSAQRDHLAGPDATPQKRGRVARQLKTDLRRVLDGDH